MDAAAIETNNRPINNQPFIIHKIIVKIYVITLHKSASIDAAKCIRVKETKHKTNTESKKAGEVAHLVSTLYENFFLENGNCALVSCLTKRLMQSKIIWQLSFKMGIALLCTVTCLQ